MRARVLPIVALLLVATVLAAGEKGGPLLVRIELEGGETVSGPARFAKEALEVDAPAGRRRVALRKIVSYEEVDPDPPAAPDPAKRAELETRKQKAGAEPAALHELARWASKNGLDDEALGVLRPLVEKDPFDKTLLAVLRPITDRRRQATAIGLPLRGRWKASQDPSHHHEAKAYAVYALDFYREVDGKAYKGSGARLEDHHAYGQPVRSVADGDVVEVRDGFPDNPVGKIGDAAEKHNGVAVLHSGGDASWYLHLKAGTIPVKKGDRVKKGQLLGKVGNSGGSAQPHLHFTLVDAYRRVSVPWRCDAYVLVAEDGTRVRVKRGRVLEGQTIEGDPEESH